MKEQFLTELNALLTKYNANIYSVIEGDTHGIHREEICIDIGSETIHTNSGWELELP